jgi:hypothetical protein
MAFAEWQLDEIRARVPVSEVVGQHFKLIKNGSEFVVADNNSFTVNDKKGFWCEFGSGGDGKPHDIFEFLRIYQGYDFVHAVEELAQRAGVTIEKHPGDRKPAQRNGAERNGAEHHERKPAKADSPRGKRETVAVWDYVDTENTLLYQVVRQHERLPDGTLRTTREGKTWKTFLQRRPSPDNDGTWILGLDLLDRDTQEPLEFVRLPNSEAWLRATEDRLQWRNITVRTFPGGTNVDHWLYGANEVLDELQEPREDQRVIFMPEGEAKVDVLREWGLLGVTNSGGAKNFTPSCAEFFRNARQVVLLQDNDRAGAERIAKIAPMLREVGVEIIQSLNFRDHWPKCPVKGDIKDWRDHGGGTRDLLLEIVDKLKPWQPEPYKSKFGAKTSFDLAAPAQQYPWRVKGIVPLNDPFLMMGPSRSGKTFATLDLVMHCCTEKPTFVGRKVVPCGAVYLTYEGVSGFENRVRAYMHHHSLTNQDLHSFTWLTKPPNLFGDEDKVRELGQEILELGRTFKLPLGIVVIDTHNASTRGSSEIKSDDIGKIMQHHDILADITGVRPWLVGHTNSEGKHRGNEQLFNAYETSMLIKRMHENDDPRKPERRDDNGRVIRRSKMEKQRDGSDHVHWDFVLQEVNIGTDEDGDPITSMVSVAPSVPEQHEHQHAPARGDRPEGIWLNDTMVGQFQALLRAIDEFGAPPPASLNLPRSVDRVITTVQLGTEWRRKVPQQDEDYAKYTNRTKSALRRFMEKMSNANVIGMDKVDRSTTEKKDVTFYIWPTGKRVRGRSFVWPSMPRRKEQASKAEQPPLLAPGEDSEQIIE